MSVEAMAVVLHHSSATGTAKLVLVGIANHDGDGGAWPAISTLARYANVHPRTVQRAISDLVEAGELRVRIQGGGDRATHPAERPNLYDIRVVCPPECDRTTRHRMPGDRGYKPTTFRPSPDLSTGVTPVSGGDASVIRGVTPTPPEPPDNHPSNTGMKITRLPKRASGHEHHFDPVSGYCTCGYRDDGRLVDIKTGIEYQPPTTSRETTA